ncbi:MAG: hypothetical protein SNJ76_02425 [Fimbriimonadaceae bacterium]
MRARRSSASLKVRSNSLFRLWMAAFSGSTKNVLISGKSMIRTPTTATVFPKSSTMPCSAS